MGCFFIYIHIHVFRGFFFCVCCHGNGVWLSCAALEWRVRPKTVTGADSLWGNKPGHRKRYNTAGHHTLLLLQILSHLLYCLSSDFSCCFFHLGKHCSSVWFKLCVQGEGHSVVAAVLGFLIEQVFKARPKKDKTGLICVTSHFKRQMWQLCGCSFVEVRLLVCNFNPFDSLFWPCCWKLTCIVYLWAQFCVSIHIRDFLWPQTV